MLITLLCLLLLLGGIIYMILAIRNQHKWDTSYICSSIIWVSLGAGLTIFCLVAILKVQVTSQIDYEKTLYQREVLVYRLENIENDVVGNELLYNEIIEFNNDLRTTKYYANNLWTNWFFNQKIATIDYIEII